ncbi:MAG: bacteriochlorophyll 4-vinyl reductase [Sphingobacteriia bacterium]|nr:bacteriochlorophyll 4-vinyl reductase [Sphingobacteriia bacterium]NCC39035.1 bacteriochlorophyll 4-vinyl reductase [Gammaproteobacteria bacterium]
MNLSQGGPAVARVGPNAIIRVAEALEERHGPAALARLLDAAELGHYRQALPTEMVDEREVTRVQTALREQLGLQEAHRIARDAGLRTGDYLLANRIPQPVQRILEVLPAPLASRVLIKAIQRNAWTFVGSGVFSARPGRPTHLMVTNGPICADVRADEPVCDFYAGSFERLFSRLVHPRARVSEIACQAMGAQACVFEVRW